jgi:hypothetical protein
MSKKPKKEPIYFRLRNMIDKETGEYVKAWICADATAKRQCEERGYKPGDLVRAELTKPRNIGFHRLAHAIGRLVLENIEGFTGTAHDVLKRLQRESGVACDVQEVDLGQFGKIPVRVARSLAFDELDEVQFRELVKAICDHIAKTYWKDLSSEQIEAMAGAMVQQ